LGQRPTSFLSTIPPPRKLQKRKIKSYQRSREIDTSFIDYSSLKRSYAYTQGQVICQHGGDVKKRYYYTSSGGTTDSEPDVTVSNVYGYVVYTAESEVLLQHSPVRPPPRPIHQPRPTHRLIRRTPHPPPLPLLHKRPD